VFDISVPIRRLRFHDFGLNHICINTGSKGSKEEFLKTLPEDIMVNIYQNPLGWTNAFVRDYEGNWIELREQV